MIRDTSTGAKLWIAAVCAVVIFFVINLTAMIATVVLSSFSTRWLGTWLPAGLTTKWYYTAWSEFQLHDVLIVTFQIVFTVVILSGLLGVTAAYAMARRNFPGRNIVMLLFLLPLLVPPITFGIPLATVLYQAGIGGTFWGVVLANLVPTVPFVILVMIPFIEQVDPKVEAAARFWRQHLPTVSLCFVADAAAGHLGCVTACAGAYGRDVRADIPYCRANQPDARGCTLLFRIRIRCAFGSVH